MPILIDMQFSLCSAASAVLVLVAGCSAASPTDTPSTVLTGAYSAISINGSALPVAVANSTGSAKQEIIADHLWIGGTAGRNGVLWHVVLRTTTDSAVTIDSTSVSGTFDATLATAQTTFGPAVAANGTLTLHANDGTTRVYQRTNQ
ncbi:MAG TPA: hypothetical protein VGM50_04015 [Gemmatimonadaceae bacterium]|jgi:hypothetical protein